MNIYKTKTKAKTSYPEYAVWNNMMNRCRHPQHPSYKWYGQLGIKVCERWHDFWNFLEDMGERPEGMELGRKDTSKDYSKDNCRWTTKTSNIRNRKNTRNVELEGQVVNFMEACNLNGFNYGVVSRRVSAGWDLEDAINRPVGVRGTVYEYNGRKMGVTELSRACGIDRSTLDFRLSHGWTMEEATNTPVRKYRKTQG